MQRGALPPRFTTWTSGEGVLACESPPCTKSTRMEEALFDEHHLAVVKQPKVLSDCQGSCLLRGSAGEERFELP